MLLVLGKKYAAYITTSCLDYQVTVQGHAEAELSLKDLFGVRELSVKTNLSFVQIH